MNKAFIILLMLLGLCRGLSAMETKAKKSTTEIKSDPFPATALIAQLKKDIPTEVGNEIGQYIIARSGVVPFMTQKIDIPCMSTEDTPQESWTPELTKKDMVVICHGKVATILSGKTGNRILTVPEASTEECEQRLPEGRQLISAQGEYKEAKLSSAGDKMVTVSTFHTRVIRDSERAEMWHSSHGSIFGRLWCMRTGTCLYTLTGHTGDIHSAKFNRSGSKIITASDDRTAQIWDVKTGDCLLTLRGHEDAVLEARFNRSGDKVATASEDGTAKLWDVETGQSLATFTLGTAVHTVKFNKHDDYLITVTSNDDVTIWSLERPFSMSFNLPNESDSGVRISFSKEGATMLAYGDGDPRMAPTAQLFRFPTNQVDPIVVYPLNNQYETIYYASFNERGDKVITAGGAGTAQIWSAATGQPIRTFLCEDGIDFAVFDRTDERIVTYCRNTNRIKVWSLSTGNCLYEIEGTLAKHHGSPFTSQKDALITTSCGGSPISLWDLSCFQRMSKRLTLEQAFLLKALYEVAFLRKLIENRLNRGIAVLDNAGNPVRSAYGIVYDFEKNPDFLKAYTELDEPLKKVLNAYVARQMMAPRASALFAILRSLF